MSIGLVGFVAIIIISIAIYDLAKNGIIKLNMFLKKRKEERKPHKIDIMNDETLRNIINDCIRARDNN